MTYDATHREAAAAAIEPSLALPQSTGPVADPLALIDTAAVTAANRIAPYWPLDSFVAVNPLLGVAEHNLGAAAYCMARAFGARLTPERSLYANKLADGTLTDDDLAWAIAALQREVPIGMTPAKLRAEALKSEPDPSAFRLPTLASVAAVAEGTDWPTILTTSISNWAADFFDTGTSLWASPGQHHSPFESYLHLMSIDHTAELLGLRGARAAFAALPTDPLELLDELVHALNVPRDGLADYFHRLLADVAGWAGYARFRGWSKELQGEGSSAARQLLAIRGAWELVLLRCQQSERLWLDWASHRSRFELDERLEWDVLFSVDRVLQEAADRSAQRQFAERLVDVASSPTSSLRPRMQLAFCIDVRSERYRRALESLADDVQTLGFAGFFGLPLAHHHPADDAATARCPVLLHPQTAVTEEEADRYFLSPREQRVLKGQWSKLKRAAIAGFGFVEAAGFGYLGTLIADFARSAKRGGPSEARPLKIDLTTEEQTGLVEDMLRGMSLTTGFAPLVVICGHGSTSRNNPYAAALDCGACGGHAGDINARVAVQMLNSPSVRLMLGERGIHIPTDTVFLAALHDTTTDLLQPYVEDLSQGIDLQTELAWLADLCGEAAQRVRAERAELLDSNDPQALVRRAGDWSQVRPELGLVRCSSFIAAPRHHTRALNLDGRAFLHDYQHEEDAGEAVLETILTAPLVVASWITLQYYGSRVDNVAFGSGDKTLHNVVGGVGVLEGGGGDLRTGLPLQSLHDGQQYIHDPMRLTAIVAAPAASMDRLLGEHPSVAALVDNGWIQLHQLTADGQVLCRVRQDQWEPVLAEPPEEAEAAA